MAAAWHKVDLLDEVAVDAVIRKVGADGLMHLAWAVTPGGYDDGVHRAWLNAGRALIRSFHQHGGRRVVVAGTCFEYDWNAGVCCEQRTPLSPNTLYGVCKDGLRKFIEEYSQNRGLSFGWGRVFFVYGPDEAPRRLVPSIIISLLKGESARCTHGRQVRDYLHSKDVADGLVRLFESSLNGTCNIGSGKGVTLREIGEAIGELLGAQSLLEFGARPAPSFEPPVILADATKLRDEVGWKPAISLADGLAETIEWWKRQLELHSVS
jgi:nucleoside-diphosphate-sugar epimerase